MEIAHRIQTTGEEQSFQEHIENVSKLCSLFMFNLNFENMAIICAKLHDMGKLAAAVQDYLYNRTQTKSDHATAGGKYIYDICNREDAISEAIAYIGIIVFSHHGGLIDALSLEGDLTLQKRFDKEIKDYDNIVVRVEKAYLKHDELSTLYTTYEQEIHDFITRSKVRNKDQRKDAQQFEVSLLIRFIFSALIDADRYDTACFFDHRPLQLEVRDVSPIWDQFIYNLDAYMGELDHTLEINQLRQGIRNQCLSFANREQGLYKLNVPTGSGKTLSSLTFALHHAKKHKNIQRIFYIIPFISILMQNAKTLKEVLCKGGKIDEHLILEHYASLIVDNEEEHKLLTERWDSTIILTTMVQFLNTLFLGKTQSARRMHQLSNSIIIFDEIQRIPLKCIHMFNSAVNFLVHECHSTVVLCSATQPTLENTPIHLQLNEEYQMIPNYEELYDKFKRVQVVDMCRKQKYKFQEVASMILDKMNEDNVNSTLLIMNTKKGAYRVYDDLKATVDEQTSLYCLTTYMCTKHREDIIKEIHEKLERKQRVICISTSMIEAGVDISFHFVIRALAGIDSIAQAAGRCNRHGELAQGIVYIINPDECLRNLQEIVNAVDITALMLDDFKKHPDKYDHELLSLKTIQYYYEAYYDKHKTELDYPVKKSSLNIPCNLYDLLSTNKKGVLAYEESNHNEQAPFGLRQAFKQAGSLFQVIEQNTIDVIVPYGEGTDMIADVYSKLSLSQQRAILRRAQAYTISLYDTTVKQLRDALVLIPDIGVYVLDGTNYDITIGCVIDGNAAGLYV